MLAVRDGAPETTPGAPDDTPVRRGKVKRSSMPIERKLLRKLADQEMPLGVSCLLVEELGSELKDFVREEYRVTPSAKTASALGNLQRRYEDQRQNAFVARSILSANVDLVRGVVGVLSVPAAATGVGAAVAVGVNVFMNELLDETLDQFDAYVAGSSRKLVGRHLQEIRDQTGKSMSDIVGMGPEAARKFLFNEERGILDRSVDFLSREDKQAAQFEMVKILGDQLTSAAAMNRMIGEANGAAISDLQEQAALIRRKQRAYDGQLVLIGKQQRALKEGVVKLGDCVAELNIGVTKNSKDISALKRHVFSQADVDGKLKMLNEGLLPEGFPKAEKAALKAQLRAVKAREQLHGTMTSYLDKAAHIDTIMKNIGIEGPDAEKFSNAVNLGQQAMAAFAAYSSGNVLGAAAAVSGMLGGGGSAPGDAAAEGRHRQVMKKLEVLERKIDTVLLTQQELLDGQRKILSGLVAVSAQVSELHAVEMEKLHETHDAVLVNRFVVVQAASNRWRALREFAAPLTRRRRAGKPLDLKFLRKHYGAKGIWFKEGKGVLAGMLSVSASYIDPFFRVSTYEGLPKNENVKVALSSRLSAWRELFGYIGRNGGIGQITEVTNTVVPTVYLLEVKSRFAPPSHCRFSDYRHLLDELISVPNLLAMWSVLREVHLFFILQKPGSEDELRTPRALANKLPEYGLRYLQNLLLLIDLAIVQENLLAGDFLIPQLYERLAGKDRLPRDGDEFIQVIRLLNANPLLKENLARYFVAKQLGLVDGTGEVGRDGGILEYALLLHDTSDLAAEISNPASVRSCFEGSVREYIEVRVGSGERPTRRWVFSLRAKVDEGEAPEACFELPLLEEYADGETRYRADMQRLTNMKSELIDLISSYKLTDYLGDNPALYQQLRFN